MPLKKHKTITLPIIFIAFVIMTFPCPLMATNHALLIGIGNYQCSDLIPPLKGPKNDVARLKKVLSENYGFSDIITLVDHQATRKTILEHIEKLGKNSSQGDKLFIYFSGHGTGAKDMQSNLPLPYNSGAIIPWDCKAGENFSIKEIMDSLIIGKRDLTEGILKKLDRDIVKNDANGEKRKIFVVFDSCFSGMAVRSIGNNATVVQRYVDLTGSRSSALGGDDDFGIDSYGVNTIKETEYPYDNVFFLAASGAHESARDIEPGELYKFPELNNQVHGAFTYALLNTLEGRNNPLRNANGQVTNQSLYDAVNTEMAPHFKQTPQFLPQAGNRAQELGNSVFFENIRTATDRLPVSQLPTVINVAVDRNYPKIRQLLNQCNTIELVEKDADLCIVEDLGKPVLTFPNNHCITRFENVPLDKIAKQVENYAHALPFINFEYDNKAFAANVSIDGNPGKKILLQGDQFHLEAKTGQRAWVIIININASGKMSVLYPFESDDFAALNSGVPKPLPEEGDSLEVLEPLGTDVIKAFFFTRKPKHYETIAGKENFNPGSQIYASLLNVLGLEYASKGRLISKDESWGRAAQATLICSSYNKNDLAPLSPH